MDIEGLGEMMVGQLVTHELLRDVSDVYGLNEAKLATLERVGEKSTRNLLNAIEDSKTRPLWRLIFALGILHVGVTSSRALANHLRSMEALMASTEEELQRIPDVGEVVGRSIHGFFQEAANRKLLARLAQAGLRMVDEAPAVGTADESSPFHGTWVITGTLSKARDEIAEEILARGGKVSGSVSKKTRYLLAGAEAGSKLEKAKKLGVRILRETEFREMLAL